MARPPLPAPQDEHDRCIFADIERVGWSVLLIHDDEGRGTPDFAYSVGLWHTFRHPEILVSGTKPQTAGQLINTIGGLVKVARQSFRPGLRYTGVVVLPVQFVAVEPRHYPEYVGYARWLYGGAEFPLLQMVYPDEDGLFPWEPGWNRTGEEGQELLGRP